MINTNLILEYFDIIYSVYKDIPKIKLILKDIKKVTIIPLLRNNSKIPYSGSQLEYYTNYLGNEIGNRVYNERKKLFSKVKLIEWYILEFNPMDREFLLDYKKSIGKKVSASLTKHYNSVDSEITKEKYKIRTELWSKKIGLQNKNRWLDIEWVTAEMSRRFEANQYERSIASRIKTMQDPNKKKLFLESMQNPIRKEKISKAAKKMWAEAKLHDLEKVKRMIYSSKNKQFIHFGIKMNSIEYLIANLLKELNISFLYESVVNLEEYTYVPDFYLPEYNTVIECYGDYWHANPVVYKSSDTIFRTPVLEIRNRDERKKELFIKYGYNFIYLWESDINNNLNQIKTQLCNILKKR